MFLNTIHLLFSEEDVVSEFNMCSDLLSNNVTWQLFWKFCNICRKMSVKEFTEGSYIMLSINFLNEALR